MSMDFPEKYGPWGIVCGGPDGIGAAFARALAAYGATWMCGGQDPLGTPPFGSVTRRAAVLRMSWR